MVGFVYKSHYDVNDFRHIIEILRAPGGCPWDIEQTHESIRRNLLEEAYEVCEAIDENDPAHLQEELGDLMMQVLFHSRIEEERGGFDLDDVADAAVKKLIYRHPHVFGDISVSGSEEVLKNWDELKRKEKSQATVTKTMTDVAGNFRCGGKALRGACRASGGYCRRGQVENNRGTGRPAVFRCECRAFCGR